MTTATITTPSGHTYRATIEDDNSVRISIRHCNDWIWAGDGKWDNGISDCAAPLGDDVYDMLDEALDTEINAADSDTPAIVPAEYRQFNANGFLRVKRWDAERKEYVQIGSFTGPDAVQRAEQRIAEDKAVR